MSIVSEMENRVWSREELMPRPELRALQLQRLRDCVERVSRVPFYREALNRNGTTSEALRGLDDLRRLPLTTKEDLRRNYPFGLFAVPREQLVRLHGSSGTTGKPTIVGYTADDLDNWSTLCARFL
ncbi:MAG: phenylacetate--CoA ligase family protein, partial [Kiritimatiellia bacterium]